MTYYKIVRIYSSALINSRTIMRNLTLSEAQQWCSDPQTSSSTCTNYVGKQRTKKIGSWFDSYQKQ